MVDVSERVKELLEEKNMNQYQLAKKSGIPMSTLSTLISKKNIPRFDTVVKICDGLNVKVSYFFKETEAYLGDTEEVVLARQLQYSSDKDREFVKGVIKYVLSQNK